MLCREAFAPTKGSGGVRCGDMTGGVEEPDEEREGKKKREREREKEKERRSERGKQRKKEME